METPSALSTELLDAVRACLDDGKFKEALDLPNDNRYADALKNNSWDLIPHLLKRIQDDTIITWPALQRCCERLLLVVAEKAKAEEVLLELIGRIENAKNDAQFIAMLLPLQCVLKRLLKKRGISLEWCLNSILYYIQQLPLPENYNFSGKENLLRDCDPNARRILKIFTELPTFYDYFIKEAVRTQTTINRSPRNILLCFLIELLGKPLALMDMSYNNKTKSHCRTCTENIFSNICTLQPNIFKFIEYINIKCNPNKKVSSDEGVLEDAPTDIFLLEEKLLPLSLGVLYYLFFAENLPVPLLPQIYNPLFISQEMLPLSIYLLQQEENLVQQKGLQLAKALIKMLPSASPPDLLSSPCHATLMKALCTVAVYSPAEPLRKLAVVIIKDYIFKFNHEGRYLLIVNLYPLLEHSGIKGYLISIYKEVLIEAIYKASESLSCFSGKRLQVILKLFCHLPQGAESDLVELADQIISALNLLRFLALRDVDNITGIWDSLTNIEENFLIPLRKGIDISRAHYEAKLLEIDEDKVEKKTEKIPISVSVDGSLLDNLPPENRKNVINSGINALHLTDSLLCRLQECINSKLSLRK